MSSVSNPSTFGGTLLGMMPGSLSPAQARVYELEKELASVAFTKPFSRGFQAGMEASFAAFQTQLLDVEHPISIRTLGLSAMQDMIEAYAYKLECFKTAAYRAMKCGHHQGCLIEVTPGTKACSACNERTSTEGVRGVEKVLEVLRTPEAVALVKDGLGIAGINSSSLDHCRVLTNLMRHIEKSLEPKEVVDAAV